MPPRTGAPLVELELLDATELDAALLVPPILAEAALELVTTPEVVFLIQ